MDSATKNQKITGDDMPGPVTLNKNDLPQQSAEVQGSSASSRNGKTVLDLFEVRAKQAPDGIAVVFENKSFTYKKLDEASNNLAIHLVNAGVRKGTFVALFLEKSIETIAAILGVLKAGGIYVPIDVNYPANRIKHMVSDATISHVLTEGPHSEKIADFLPQGTAFTVSELINQTAELSKESEKPVKEDLAYLIYTSGTTGTPKGVTIEHGALSNYIQKQSEFLQINHLERVLQFSNYSFDASVEQIFLALTNGATLVIPSQDVLMDNESMAAFIDDMEITHIHATPSFLKFIPVRKYSNLKRIIAAGERCARELADAWCAYVEFINKYGPTESTISTHEYRYQKNDAPAGSVPIGKPLPGITQRVLTENGAPANVGDIGELLIGGDQLSPGYLNLPELTADRFIYSDGERRYRTGDLVRVLSNDTLEYIGRTDEQLKIRGYRIEPGEIEYHVSRLTGIESAVVTVRDDLSGIQVLVAYVILTKSENTEAGVYEVTKSTIKEWRNQLAMSLPNHMIPNAWIALERFPLTANNKIDRNALPAPYADENGMMPDDADTYTATQRLAADVWTQVLRVQRVGLDDDFFELGGHSLSAMQVLTAIRRQTGKHVSITALLRNPKLRDFAVLLNTDTAQPLVDRYPTADQKMPMSATADEPGLCIPMIDQQQEIWLSCQLGGRQANLAYNQSVTLELTGKMDVPAMHNAVSDLVARHVALRVCVGDEESLVISDMPTAILVVKHFAVGSSPQEKQAVFNRFIHSEMRQEFDLTAAPLFRVFLHQFDNTHTRLTLIAHHIICDATAMRVVVRDLAALYNAHSNGSVPRLPPAQQLQAYAAHQQAFSKSSEHRKMLEFWLAQHKTVEPLNLPLDFKRPATRTYDANFKRNTLGDNIYGRLSALAAKAGISIAAAITALVEVFLYHRTGQRDITLGLTTAGQYLSGYEQMVGHSVNLIPVRTTIDPRQSFLNYLSVRREGLYLAYENQRLTFSELLRELRIKRDKAHIPLVPFVLTIQADGGPTAEFEGLELNIRPNPCASQTFEIFLSINLDRSNEVIDAFWAYNTRLFAGDTIERMINEFKLLLETVTQIPDVEIGHSLPIPHPFPQFENYVCEYPNDTTLVDHFYWQTKRTPKLTAVQFEGKSMTYRELNRKSNQIANRLITMGVSRGEFVILCVKPSMEMVAAFLGIWKTGAAYVPLDPELPHERVSHIVEKTGAKVAVLDRDATTIMPLVTIGNILVVDAPDCLVWQERWQKPTVKPDPGSPAYVIYTSGSTGNPKGVTINHQSLVDYHFGLLNHVPQFARCNGFALGSPIYTDLGNTVLFGALVTGGTLHLFGKERFNDPDYISRYFSQHTIDFLKIVPSHWNYLVSTGVRIIPKEILMLGGEGLQTSLVTAVYQAGGTCAIINEYGPTETTIGKLLHIVDPASEYGHTIPIGKPYSNASIYVLNENQTHCPIGVPGELYIGGIGLSSGYVGEPELTDRAFIDIGHGGATVGKRYKTGDIVRWLSDGNIEYLGRKDDQVKIRGNRIELAEIESAISKLDEVTQCAVAAANRDTHQEKLLVAYVVPHTDRPFNRESAIERLRKVLPTYMIPRHWVIIDKIPLNANGKADKKALLMHDSGVGKDEVREFVAATTPTQLKLAEIWSECLMTDQEIGITDDFFELGGHSLIAVRIVAKVDRHFGVRLPLASLFEHTTIEKMAAVIDQGIDPLRWDCVIPIRASGNKPPLFVVHGALLDVLYVRNLLPYLDREQPLYGIQGMGLSGKSQAAHTVERIAAHYVCEMLTHEPNGPFALAGYSSGGVIAFEMVKQLRQHGKEVIFLGLLDTFATVPDDNGMAGTIRFWRAVFKEAFAQYGYIQSFLFLSFLAFDKILQLTLAQVSKRAYRRMFPADYWKSKAQLIHVLAGRKYRPAAIDMNTYLFKSFRMQVGKLDESAKTNGWSPFLGENLTVVGIQGSHFDMFTPEKVEDLANAVQKAINNSTK
ncbi:amino acid adenylation domain-containing protein [Parapedobacter deserti]|uniref:Amino acid adenylation domain-containing protein n=1 Tax=Parapedobacter deserti TaxID=1912957 RepID=A0ABV7JJA9_9SPHI